MNLIIITENGRRKIEAEIIKKEESIRKIQEEKAVAYSVSGDGWHDNPGFNNLTLLEEREMNALAILRKKLANAKIWDKKERNTQKVEIGSIIKVRIMNSSTKVITESLYEIVGSGESDLSKNLIAYDTPIGLAVLNMKKNDVRQAQIPVGKVKIELLEFYTGWNNINL